MLNCLNGCNLFSPEAFCFVLHFLEIAANPPVTATVLCLPRTFTTSSVVGITSNLVFEDLISSRNVTLIFVIKSRDHLCWLLYVFCATNHRAPVITESATFFSEDLQKRTFKFSLSLISRTIWRFASRSLKTNRLITSLDNCNNIYTVTSDWQEAADKQRDNCIVSEKVQK